MKVYKVEHGTWCTIQFIKNHIGNPVCKSFRKYNKVQAWYSEWHTCWVHYSGTHIHFIPNEFVKIVKELKWLN